jgi:hypothetical protein
MKSKYLLTLIIILLVGSSAFAHTINYDLSKMSKIDIGWVYLKLGYTHIIPLGFDHILFVLSLFFLTQKLSSIIWQASAFTIAHSITLGLAMYGVIKPVSSIVEPIIALSIVFVALENIFTVGKLNWWRVAIVFGFGLVHGMGFASALIDLGLPKTEFLNALISFNVGVEIGQISIIMAAYLLIGVWFWKKPWYRPRIVYPASAAIASIAAFWTIQRLFFI